MLKTAVSPAPGPVPPQLDAVAQLVAPVPPPAVQVKVLAWAQTASAHTTTTKITHDMRFITFSFNIIKRLLKFQNLTLSL